MNCFIRIKAWLLPKLCIVGIMLQPTLFSIAVVLFLSRKHLWESSAWDLRLPFPLAVQSAPLSLPPTYWAARPNLVLSFCAAKCSWLKLWRTHSIYHHLRKHGICKPPERSFLLQLQKLNAAALPATREFPFIGGFKLTSSCAKESCALVAGQWRMMIHHAIQWHFFPKTPLSVFKSLEQRHQ